MPQPYFYCCSLPLQVGSIILPGNWGRIIRTYTPQSCQHPWLLTRELVYELVRVKDFPRKPSRLECLFLCMNEADLNEFRTTYNRHLDLGYEVELVDPQSPNHIADWTLPNMQNSDNLTVTENRATLYWRGENIVKQELLTVSPIRIMRVL